MVEYCVVTLKLCAVKFKVIKLQEEILAVSPLDLFFSLNDPYQPINLLYQITVIFINYKSSVKKFTDKHKFIPVNFSSV